MAAHYGMATPSQTSLLYEMDGMAGPMAMSIRMCWISLLHSLWSAQIVHCLHRLSTSYFIAYRIGVVYLLVNIDKSFPPILYEATKEVLVYDASWYQSLILPSRVIVHPALKTRACNANHVLTLSRCSLAWCHPLVYVLWVQRGSCDQPYCHTVRYGYCR
jgi:hypothetical protein